MIKSSLDHRPISASLSGQKMGWKTLIYKQPHKQLFSYAKGHDAAWVDPNAELMPK
jgi:hypothetical protein